MPSLKSLYQALLALSLTFSATASPLLEKRTARTSTPSGCLTVRGSGTKSGEYSTVGAALKALGSSTAAACIFIYSGTYAEQITINYAGALTIYGYTTEYVLQPFGFFSSSSYILQAVSVFLALCIFPALCIFSPLFLYFSSSVCLLPALYLSFYLCLSFPSSVYLFQAPYPFPQMHIHGI
jgi:hypothetical protein